MPSSPSVRGSCAVVIPVLDGAAWIEQAIASVLSQTRPPAEVVVVDDGSTDDSAARAAGFGAVRVVRIPHQGLSAARNVGLTETRSDLIAFLDVDDVWHPAFLETLSQLLDHAPRAPAAFAEPAPFRDGGAPALEPPRGNAGWYDPWQLFPFGNRIHCPSQLLIRRESLVSVGLWHSAFDGAEDTHIYLRLTETHPMIRLPARLVGRRVHRDSLFHTLLRERAMGRLEIRGAAWTDAGTHRLGCLGARADRRRLVRQMRWLRAATGLARAWVDGSPAGLRAAAERLSRLMRQAPADQWDRLFEMLVRGLCSVTPYRVDPATSSRLLAGLWSAWPSGDSPGSGTLFRLLAHAVQQVAQDRDGSAVGGSRSGRPAAKAGAAS